MPDDLATFLLRYQNVLGVQWPHYGRGTNTRESHSGIRRMLQLEFQVWDKRFHLPVARLVHVGRPCADPLFGFKCRVLSIFFILEDRWALRGHCSEAVALAQSCLVHATTRAVRIPRRIFHRGDGCSTRMTFMLLHLRARSMILYRISLFMEVAAIITANYCSHGGHQSSIYSFFSVCSC
jgi:hypothetical protein